MRSFATKAFLVMLVGASTAAATAENRHVRLKSRDPKDERPFSDAVRVGQTLYLAGRIGLHPATNKPPADAAAEVRTVMDQIKAVLVQEGMTMDDLVTVTVYCTDLSLYGTFNDVRLSDDLRLGNEGLLDSNQGIKFLVQDNDIGNDLIDVQLQNGAGGNGGRHERSSDPRDHCAFTSFLTKRTGAGRIPEFPGRPFRGRKQTLQA